MALAFMNGSAAISTTEYWLASNSTTKTDQTDDAMLQVWIDFGNMIAGDQYQIRIVEKINGGTQRDVAGGPAVVTGAQAGPWQAPALFVGEAWEVGVKRLAGADRTIAWSLRKAT